MLFLSDALGVSVVSEQWNGVDSLPYYLSETYDFRKVAFSNDVVCIFAETRGEVPTVSAIAKQFAVVHATSNFPVVLKQHSLTNGRRKALIENRIPFVTDNQIYLPFLGVLLQNELYSEPKAREKLMPSAQMLFFAYLYNNTNKMHTSAIAEKIGTSSMQITRAVRQLNKLNLFEVSKEGVQIVVRGKLNHRALFEAAAPYLLDPVRDILYVPRNEQAEQLPLAGISALSENSMLAAPNLRTFAFYSKSEKLQGESGLTDNERQVRVEIWKYNPLTLSDEKNIADPLSVIVSLKNEKPDERVEQAIDGILTNLWG
jgi:DNA-binding MarR family transcriptional regulator